MKVSVQYRLMENRKWFIYALIDPRDGAIRYVGWTIDLKRRLRDHTKPSAITKRNYRANWIRSLREISMMPTMLMLQEGSGDGWQQAERRWISELRARGAQLTNTTDGGDGTPGRHPSPETCARWSEIRKGRAPHPNCIAASIDAHRGKTRPSEHMEPMRAAVRGKPKSAAHREALGAAKKGKPLSAAHRAAIGSAQTGVPHPLTPAVRRMNRVNL